MTTINIRTNEKLKKDANKVFKEVGLDMSNAVKLFLHQVVITKTIPFQIRTENGFTVEEEQQILKDAEELEKDIKSGKAKFYKSAEALTKDLLK